MTVFAISDLHLGHSVDKPMDRFGPQWVGHAERVARAWRERVRDTDTVLVCGDTSWAMRLEEAAADLAWLGALPGRKILLRGNHDYWWGSLKRLRGALPAGIEPLQNDSHIAEGWSICGSRGWLLPTSESRPEDRAIFERELGRLRMSLESAGGGRPKLAMLHYPPWMPGAEQSWDSFPVRVGGPGGLRAAGRVEQRNDRGWPRDRLVNLFSNFRPSGHPRPLRDTPPST
jgi:predicted phosphohydrolase